MKINFNKLEIEVFNGEKVKVKVAKEVGNMLYFGAADIASLEVAKKIYAGEEVDLSDHDCEVLTILIESKECLLRAFIKEHLLQILKNNKK